jgi:DNA-binding LacI/PurR family transcriptional regulator
LPVVAIWSQQVPDTIGYVDIDHCAGAYQALQHLLELGHRRIAYVEADPVFKHPHFIARYQGYRQALLNAGIEPRPEWHAIGVDEPHIDALLHLPEPVTAIFTPNDITAGEVAQILHALHKHIPTDISLVGFDDIANANLIAGGLTTIHQPIQEISIQAVRNLTALIGGTAVVHCRTILPTHLVVRNSSAPPLS